MRSLGRVETLSSAIVGVGVIALSVLTFVLAVAVPLGGLYLLVRFVKWAGWIEPFVRSPVAKGFA
jgi:hypothetical protein